MRDSFLDPPKRKQNRLRGYDYGRPGYYFVTICANQRAEFFWDMVAENLAVKLGSCVGRDDLGAPYANLSHYGHIVEKYIVSIPTAYDGVFVDKYVIMPNHVHLIIRVNRSEDGAPRSSRPTRLIPRIIAAMKRFSNQEAGFNMWQTSYHDHIIRSEADYRRIWEYIDTNPSKWREDCYYEDGVKQVAKKDEKTNVMRILEQKNIPYTPHAYDGAAGLDGASVARQLGQDPESVFKTLVARGASGGLYVFDIPVEDSLDLKKAAKAVGEKSVAMLPQRELLPLTGYVHGGCSPVGMKKQYPTVFHETAEILDSILVSAGKIGFQVELNPAALMGLVGGTTADLTI